MTFLIGGANSVSEYNVTNGVRGVIADRPTLKRDLDTATDVDKFTLSFWFKPHTSTTDATLDSRVSQQIWCSLDGSGDAQGYLHYSDASNAQFSFYDPHSGTNPNINWSPLYRDFSAWYHIVLVGDTSQGTDTNRVKFYVNGTQVTATDSATWPDEDGDFTFGNASYSHMWFDGTVGKSAWYEVQPCDSSFAELAFVDGSALTPSSFGETDEDSGIWKPKLLSGITWGNNGHFMEFKQSGTGTAGEGTIGADTSGNDNHFTSDSLAADHMITDTPTNNFCTFNKNHPDTTGSQSYLWYEGNTLIRTTANNWFNAFGTIGITNGKWYYEYKTTGSGSVDQIIGFIKSNFHRGSDGGIDQVDCYSLYAGSDGNGYLFTDSASGVDKGTGYHWTFDDIMMVAIDTSSRKIWYGKNGTWLGSGDPAAGSNEVHVVSAEDMAYGLLPAISGYHTAAYAYINFGNPAYANSSSQADDNGYGDFEYDVPTGFYALCSKNLAEFG